MLLCVLMIVLSCHVVTSYAGSIPQAEDSWLHKRAPPHAPVDIHGGVKMGEVRHDCDDLKWNLEIDWANKTDYEYTCQMNEEIIHPRDDDMLMRECINKEDIPMPIHVCMDKHIIYNDLPPTAGPHRPNWPSFGTYMYCPPQRWVHSLEHGSVVLLFHPCVASEQVALLAAIVRSCIRKHIITPYRQLPADQPLALVTYGCKLLMSRVNPKEVIQFIKDTAMQTEESPVTKDGLYSMGQIHNASIVSDIKDSVLCPRPPITPSFPIAENMAQPYIPQAEEQEDDQQEAPNTIT